MRCRAPGLFPPAPTRRGQRTVEPDSYTLEVLASHKRAQAEQRRVLGLPGSSELAFTKPDGTNFHPDNVRQAFDDEFSEPTFRASGSAICVTPTPTLLLKAGAPPKVVSERLGRATVAFTMDVHAHVIPGMQAEACRSTASGNHNGGLKSPPLWILDGGGGGI